MSSLLILVVNNSILYHQEYHLAYFKSGSSLLEHNRANIVFTLFPCSSLSLLCKQNFQLHCWCRVSVLFSIESQSAGGGSKIKVTEPEMMVAEPDRNCVLLRLRMDTAGMNLFSFLQRFETRENMMAMRCNPLTNRISTINIVYPCCPIPILLCRFLNKSHKFEKLLSQILISHFH